MSRDAIKAEVQRRLAQERQTVRPPVPAPRYDDVFFEGVAWLDSLAEDENPTQG